MGRFDDVDGLDVRMQHERTCCFTFVITEEVGAAC
jgi:hypothetical protein